jgi:hypothetical protein
MNILIKNTVHKKKISTEKSEEIQNYCDIKIKCT